MVAILGPRRGCFPLLTGLQKREIDIKPAYANVNLVKNSLCESAKRATLERIHKDLFDLFVGSKPYKPRVWGRMQHRENHPVTESVDYHRVTVMTQFLNHIISEIETRFGDTPINVIRGFSVIPSFFINENQINWKDEFVAFAQVYKGDLP